MNISGIEPDIFNWVALPLFIFIARVLDVTLGTMRIIFVARGRRSLAPIFGFVEVFIWVVAIGQIVRNLSNPFCYLAYAAGFAAGNYVGLALEDKLAIGMLAVRVILIQQAAELAERLHTAGFGATQIPAYGASGQVGMVYLIIKRKNLECVVKIIQEFNPKAFYTVEEVRSVAQGFFPHTENYRSYLGIVKKK